ncbi:hypothetical protein H9L15_12920 [Sphingomonas daechungensis]|uniref:Lipoprotein n=1 Tax=Sphingomonas daechungensis TaxID=1176646 RepID=A0ABX6T696_9SPHN|nr:hypothetical protein [Sphingomonas daechungensis]QNP44535.1 hypothetical protein H9L15_12920 [Sphingomonas daechungensis]
MRKLAIGGSLAVLALAGCTTSGVGTGQSAVGNVGATFTYTQTGATRGTMVASLTNGQVFQGQFFQVTQESRVTDFGSLWNGWGPGWGWGRGWGGRRWVTAGADGALGSVRRNDHPLQRPDPREFAGPGGFMRCNFSLARPSSGMAGGGAGQCQLPTGAIIHAQFPTAYGAY